jgi:hypothetical protein
VKERYQVQGTREKTMRLGSNKAIKQEGRKAIKL